MEVKKKISLGLGTALLAASLTTASAAPAGASPLNIAGEPCVPVMQEMVLFMPGWVDTWHLKRTQPSVCTYKVDRYNMWTRKFTTRWVDTRRMPFFRP